jgi:hypothetical protein
MDTVFLPRTSLRRKSPQISYSPRVEANSWVKLLQRHTSFSSDKALLLYPISSQEWMAWVPEHGEISLNVRQFCKIQ